MQCKSRQQKHERASREEVEEQAAERIAAEAPEAKAAAEDAAAERDGMLHGSSLCGWSAWRDTAHAAQRMQHGASIGDGVALGAWRAWLSFGLMLA